MKAPMLYSMLAAAMVFPVQIAFADEVTEVPQVTIARDGAAQLPIVAGSVKQQAVELKRYLDRITGGDFTLAEGEQQGGAIYVGLAKEFGWVNVDGIGKLGPEGFVLRSDEQSVYAVANEPLGVERAVATLLNELGCRWFFPGETWEVVPRRKTIVVALDERQAPSFPTQRRIWYGFGAFGPCAEDLQAWVRHNRAGGPLDVAIGHSWCGINPEKDFETHPEWFALVAGKRQPSKPCYTHPEVLAKAKAQALAAAQRGERMISLTPPDGLGYCSCENCLKAAGVKEFHEDKGSFFGKRDDGTLVNVTSETVFRFVNEVAAAVAEKHPQTLVGCYAYSAYSHPPSFELHPNVYLQTTTAYRRTPLTLEEQLKAFGAKTQQLGIREYYSVYQWDWDYPDPGKLAPDELQKDLKFFHDAGVTAINAESSNNWAPRGLGYYVAAQLMWNVDADVNAIVRDFYEQAFGPAARPMERYYVRWYGPSVAVLDRDGAEPPTELRQKQIYFDKGKHNLAALRDAYRDLDEAAKLAEDDAAILARINDLRMYQHYLLLRWQLEQAEATGDRDKILAAIEAEITFGARLTYTNMIHARPLIGKAFERRFRQHAKLLEGVADAKPDGPWRKIGTPPDATEIEQLWAEDKRLLAE